MITETHKAKATRNEFNEVEFYEYRGQIIDRADDTTAGGGRFHVGDVLNHRQFPTLREAKAHIDRLAR
jgi:hypothetical protein